MTAISLHAPGTVHSAPQVVDRIVARVEGDIIAQSELRELAAYERLQAPPHTPSAAGAQLLSRAVEQWIVSTEAAAARFPRPSREEVAREVARLEKSLSASERLDARLREVGLTRAAFARLVERQIFLARYLDYKFRPAAQIEPGLIERYYSQELLPELRRKGEPIPPLAAVEDHIRELLVQKEITTRAARWLEETRSRLRIEIDMEGPER